MSSRCVLLLTEGHSIESFMPKCDMITVPHTPIDYFTRDKITNVKKTPAFSLPLLTYVVRSFNCARFFK